MISTGTLYIIAAASGTGKSSLADALANTMENIRISVSHTTRPRKANEQDNQHYFFIEPSEFELLIKQKAFLEYAKVFDHYYGTTRKFVADQLGKGIDVILDIDWQGAREVRKQIDCVSIFLLPPSKDELKKRLERRNRDDAATIIKRLATANSEISHYKEFDYVIINDKFEDALSDLQAIVRSNRLLAKNQEKKYNATIQELLR